MKKKLLIFLWLFASMSSNILYTSQQTAQNAQEEKLLKELDIILKKPEYIYVPVNELDYEILDVNLQKYALNKKTDTSYLNKLLVEVFNLIKNYYKQATNKNELSFANTADGFNKFKDLITKRPISSSSPIITDAKTTLKNIQALIKSPKYANTAITDDEIALFKKSMGILDINLDGILLEILFMIKHPLFAASQEDQRSGSGSIPTTNYREDLWNKIMALVNTIKKKK